MFSRNKNLKEILEARKWVIRNKNKILGNRKCQACNFCKYIYEGPTSTINMRNIKLTNNFDCKTARVVYVGLRQHCKSFYIGKTKRRLFERVKEHLYYIKCKKIPMPYSNIKWNSLNTPIVNSQSWNVLKLMKGGGDWENLLACRELFWQVFLDARSPPGLSEATNIKCLLKRKRDRL